MAFSSWRTWVTGEVVTAAHMNQEIRDNGLALFPNGMAGASWSPTLQATTTNPTASVLQGRQYRVGALQFVWVRIGHSVGGGSGSFFVELPVAASGIGANGASHSGQAIGSWSARDVDTPANNESGVVTLRSSTTVLFVRSDNGNVTESNPFVWDANDILTFQAVYPVA